MEWQEVPETVDRWRQRVEIPARLIKAAVADVYTSADVGYYVHPETLDFAIFNEGTPRDGALCKAALARADGADALRTSPFLSRQELEDPESKWVKVAYSASLNKALQYLNFFPGQYPGGIPNFPSPAAAMLTTGVVGAGLGYGVGTLAGKLLPKGYGDRMGRTGMILGGLLGAAPGGAWAVANHANGKSVIDPWPFNNTSDAPPDPWGLKQAADAWADVELSEQHRDAIEKCADSFGDFALPQAPTPGDVNINALGQTLWENNASPQLTGATLSAIYAASQLPDPHARPGVVTGRQLSLLTGGTVGDFATGYLAGVMLNKAIGSPVHPATIGLISAVVPKLFGR